MKKQNSNPTQFTSILNQAIQAIQNQYPNLEISFKFQPGTQTWDSPDGKLYLWATMEDANNLTFFPTDTDEIDESGVYTTEITTEGLTIIIAEDF